MSSKATAVFVRRLSFLLSRQCAKVVGSYFLQELWLGLFNERLGDIFLLNELWTLRSIYGHIFQLSFLNCFQNAGIFLGCLSGLVFQDIPFQELWTSSLSQFMSLNFWSPEKTLLGVLLTNFCVQLIVFVPIKSIHLILESTGMILKCLFHFLRFF